MEKPPKKLKILHTVTIKKKEWVAVILDEKNYGFGMIGTSEKGDEFLANANYFGQMEHLVEHIAKQTADDQCKELWDWLRLYRRVLIQFLDGFKE